MSSEVKDCSIEQGAELAGGDPSPGWHSLCPTLAISVLDSFLWLLRPVADIVS